MADPQRAFTVSTWWTVQLSPLSTMFEPRFEPGVLHREPTLRMFLRPSKISSDMV